MPSWSTSNPRDDVTLPRVPGSTNPVERVRRLLEQLFAGRGRAEQPPPSKR
jgi:hypothetical protein